MNVFDYTRADEFLKSAWRSKHLKNTQFTIRSWASLLGIKHHANLHEMMNGKRKIPKSYIPKFISSLSLNVNEGLYFESMVDLSRASSAEERTLYLDRMKAISPVRNAVRFTELESFRMLQDPLHFFICEMVFLPDFKADPYWIQKRLSFKADLVQINEVIERLIAIDILREDPEGRLLRVDRFIQSKSDIQDKALQEYHCRLADLAKGAVTSQDVLEREFQAMTINFDKEQILEAKQMIRDFIVQFTTRFDHPKGGCPEVYHLNMNFFGITNIGESK